jgi:hypothetical protein
MSTAPVPKKGRRDHYLPQGYLRGFIDPARGTESQPLWVLDVRYNKWYMKAPKQVAHGEGFYDYAGDSPELQDLETADEAFLELENTFPTVRDKLISEEFRHWKHHPKFLFRFMQMLRARSPLFFEQKQAEGTNLKTWTIKKVHPDGKTITLDSIEAKPLPTPLSRILLSTTCGKKSKKAQIGFGSSIGHCATQIQLNNRL